VVSVAADGRATVPDQGENRVPPTGFCLRKPTPSVRLSSSYYSFRHLAALASHWRGAINMPGKGLPPCRRGEGHRRSPQAMTLQHRVRGSARRRHVPRQRPHGLSPAANTVSVGVILPLSPSSPTSTRVPPGGAIINLQRRGGLRRCLSVVSAKRSYKGPSGWCRTIHSTVRPARLSSISPVMVRAIPGAQSRSSTSSGRGVANGAERPEW
jgi:hypothetical protein